MVQEKEYPSYSTCVAELLSRSRTPLGVDSLLSSIERRRPVGPGARSAVYQAISALYQAIPVEPGRFGWLSCLLKGQRFRHPLGRNEVQRGNLLLDELEHAVFFPQFFQNQKPDSRLITVALLGGPTLQARSGNERGNWALPLGTPFVKWLNDSGGAASDDLLIQVEDAVTGNYNVRLHPKESRQEDQIRLRNDLLSRTAEKIVGMDRKSRIAVPVCELAAALIGQNVFSHEIPPDDMHYVLHEYSSLHLVDDSGYATEQTRKSGGNDASRENDSSTDPSSEGGPKTQPEKRNSDLLNQVFRMGGHLTLPPSGWVNGEFSSNFADEEDCEAYVEYLGEHRKLNPETPPLNHVEYHILEAELELLVSLEHEFGFLMADQERRKAELADRLYIDPDLLVGNDWDQDDLGDLPYWNN